MKALRNLVWVFGLVVLMSVKSATVALAAETKMAYVDVEKIFDEYEKTKKFDGELQTEGKGKQSKRDAIVSDIRKLKDEQALLSEDKKKQKQTEIESKLKDLDSFDESARKELGEKRNNVMKEIFTDIDTLLRSYGQRKGYDFILNERALLYKNSKYDETANVLKELNENYRKQKK